MDITGLVERVYLPLLTQETAVMVATFTYGLKEGMQPWALAATDSAAVLTDLVLFFAPTYALARRFQSLTERHAWHEYDRATRLVSRWGAFRSSAMMAFVMPSVTSMITAGLLRPPFSRALGGLIVGSTLYIVIPLALALPLAANLPPFVVGILPWVGPILALIVVLASLYRARRLLPHL